MRSGFGVAAKPTPHQEVRGNSRPIIPWGERGAKVNEEVARKMEVN
jgi:hypothetical protein